MKQVIAWLRMFSPGDIPHSEAAYTAHLGSIDMAIPTNGGKLQADGMWLQQPWKIDPEWPQSLPETARSAGQLYIPTVADDKEQTVAVLESERAQQAAVDGLVRLALSDRFDSPWDGVLIDIENTPTAYQEQLSEFMRLLSGKLRAAGITVGISIRGRVGDTGSDYDTCYGYDFSVVAQAADFVDLRCYGYWKPFPRSIAPHWWIKDCIEYALGKGIPAQRILLGLGIFSRYRPDDNLGSKIDVTHERALEMIREADASLEWIERNENGLVRERYAAEVGDGHIWLHDADTLRHGLGLIDEYGLRGLSLFIPGMGDESIWHTIADWKQEPEPRPGCRPLKRPKVGNHNCDYYGASGLFSTGT